MHTHAGSQGYANPILGYPGVSRLEVYEVVNSVGRFSSGQLRERNCSTSPSGPNLGAVGSLCITRGTFPGAHGLGGTEVNRVVGGWFLWCLQVGCVLNRFVTQRYLHWYILRTKGAVLEANSLVSGVRVHATEWSVLSGLSLCSVHSSFSGEMLYRREKLQTLTALWKCQQALQAKPHRTAARALGRKVARVRKQVRKVKQHKTRHIRIRMFQQQQEHREWQREWRMATWNTRGLGATTGYINQELKIQCLLTRMALQRWGLITLTDLMFRENGVRTYRHRGKSWYLVHRQQVGFLMSEVWWNWWQAGGAVVYQKSSRVAAIDFPRMGWRRGLYVAGIYAPTSASGKEERNTLRHDLELILEPAPATSLITVMGDFNAEMGNNHNRTISGWDAVGHFSNPKITTPGQEWRDWCSRHGYRDVASRFQCRNRVSWIHPRYLSQHELDHILVKGVDVWHLKQCRFLLEGSNVAAPWSTYTDHNPVELVLKVGKHWSPNPRTASRVALPDVARMRGQDEEANTLRMRWVQQVETKLSNLSGSPNWDEICNLCRTTAVEVCGILKLHHGAPWLRYHGTEIQQLDTNIMNAQHRDREARRQGDPHSMQQCRTALQHARKIKAQKVRQWETTWLSQKAEEANRVMGTPSSTKVFQLVKELIAAAGKGNWDGGRIQAGSLLKWKSGKIIFRPYSKVLGTWMTLFGRTYHHGTQSCSWMTHHPGRNLYGLFGI